jgi:O-antigen/teichoic acid export membrane protein
LGVAGGYAIWGAASYAFLVLAGQVLGPTEFTGVATLYLLVAGVASALFMPVEQELSRRAGRRAVTGEPLGPVVTGVALLAAAVCVAVAVLCLLGFGQMRDVLGNQGGLVAAVPVGMTGYAVCFVQRGLFAGEGRLDRYTIQLVVESLSRLPALGVLCVLDEATSETVGWAFALSPWLAALAAAMWRPRRHGHGSPGWRSGRSGPIPWAELARALGGLLVAAIGTQAVANVGPVAMQVTAHDLDRPEVAAFLAAVLIARVPAFMVVAVQPTVLPRMAAHVQAGDWAAFSGVARRAVWAAAGCGGLLAAGMYAIGPLVVEAVFGFEQTPDRGSFLALGVGGGVYLVAAVLAVCLVARGAFRGVVAGWLAGGFGSVAGAFLEGDPVQRCWMAVLLGSVSAALVMFRFMKAPTGLARAAP